ncbi:MAG TPA: cupin domain-containing protein [Caulobacteraceae bacterium]|jgi:uncharacterized cupin superfamily protein
MPKIDLDAAPRRSGTGYPPPYDEPCRLRERVRLGKAAGLTQFGVNLLHLPPGQWSSQRHWHAREDEFVWIIEGEVVLIDDSGERVLRAGDCAGFPAGDRNGHHLQNRSDRTALLLEVGTSDPDGDAVDYPDIDLTIPDGESGYFHRDGRPY